MTTECAISSLILQHQKLEMQVTEGKRPNPDLDRCLLASVATGVDVGRMQPAASLGQCG